MVELKQSSVVQRFLTGWMPTAIRLVFGDKRVELALLIFSRRGRYWFWLKSKAGKSASVNAVRKVNWVTGPVAVPKLGIEGWISPS